MTDEQITRALAEKVMEWEYGPASNEPGAYHRWHKNGKWARGATWNPLTSDADACAVLDKMSKSGEVGVLFEDGIWSVGFGVVNEHVSRGDDRRRAICIAALKAVGAWSGCLADD